MRGANLDISTVLCILIANVVVVTMQRSLVANNRVVQGLITIFIVL